MCTFELNHSDMKNFSFQFAVLGLMAFGFPGTLDNAFSQEASTTEVITTASSAVRYPNLTLRKVLKAENQLAFVAPDELEFEELTALEEEMVEDLGSLWAWPENTLDMIDSYSPFLFRTKKSREIEEVKLLLYVNEKGSVSGFEMISQVDNGLKQRLDYMIRKLPKCKPVPGFERYGYESFELTIQK